MKCDLLLKEQHVNQVWLKAKMLRKLLGTNKTEITRKLGNHVTGNLVLYLISLG
jgi:hypothetical protein